MSLQQGEGSLRSPHHVPKYRIFRAISPVSKHFGRFFGIVGSHHRVCATIKYCAGEGSLPVRRWMVAPAFLVYLLTGRAA
jgi:hypothetical protein